MIIASSMSQEDITSREDDDDHEHDMVMPGFRFHPTEEELVEFYLRRKVEGKRFNVELITSLDLYRHDPWELPALAAIGEKEWYFYVPRDRKYRNGDRPNRVTTSGYWKATGADKIIRIENRSIGLKKTLVFYTGKAPKGIRTSWIMNEFRLPHHETERYQKAEISLCRVHKRPGVEDHPSVPRCILPRASSSRMSHSHVDQKKQQDVVAMEKFQSFAGHSQQNEMDSGTDIETALALSKNINTPYRTMTPIRSPTLGVVLPLHENEMLMQQSKALPSSVVPNCTNILFSGSPLPISSINGVDELHRLLSYQQVSSSLNDQQQQFHMSTQYQQPPQLISTLPPHSQPLALSRLPSSLPAANFQERFWEWNHIAEASKDYNPFK